MANTGKDTNRAQFFLLFRPQPHLNGKHVVFGRVVGGLSTLDAVEAVGSTSGMPNWSRRVLLSVSERSDSKRSWLWPRMGAATEDGAKATN